MSPLTISAAIPVEMVDALAIAASRKGYSQSQAITEALENWLDLQERRHQMILEALKDIDEGRTHSHEEIKAWIASLDRD